MTAQGIFDGILAFIILMPALIVIVTLVVTISEMDD